MNAKLNVNIHNKFDIEVLDITTGKIRQRAEAYNIVLDSMWTQLLGFSSSYFSWISFGTGSGTLDKSRTTLFNYLGTKTAVTDTIVKDIPVSSWKRRIVLNPEE
jgi:hypothetical protein